jgi:Ca2+/Na+ antiporter
LKRADFALAIIFATSVAVLSLMQGTMALVSPRADSPAGPRRLWPFVLPAALLTLLAGFAGGLTRIHAAAFFCEGLVFFFAWPEINGKKESGAAPAKSAGGNDFPLAAAGVFIACAGAGAAVFGAVAVMKSLPMAQGTGMAALLAPLLVWPMLSGGATLAQQDRGWVATSAGVGLVLLNLCLLLPIVIMAHWQIAGKPLAFSILTWRVDNVILILLAFILFPISMGRWRLGRAEGITLLAFYLVYVLMEIAAGLQS